MKRFFSIIIPCIFIIFLASSIISVESFAYGPDNTSVDVEGNYLVTFEKNDRTPCVINFFVMTEPFGPSYMVGNNRNHFYFYLSDGEYSYIDYDPALGQAALFDSGHGYLKYEFLGSNCQIIEKTEYGELRLYQFAVENGTYVFAEPYPDAAGTDLYMVAPTGNMYFDDEWIGTHYDDLFKEAEVTLENETYAVYAMMGSRAWVEEHSSDFCQYTIEHRNLSDFVVSDSPEDTKEDTVIEANEDITTSEIEPAQSEVSGDSVVEPETEREQLNEHKTDNEIEVNSSSIDILKNIPIVIGIGIG